MDNPSLTADRLRGSVPVPRPEKNIGVRIPSKDYRDRLKRLVANIQRLNVLGFDESKVNAGIADELLAKKKRRRRKA